MMDRFREGRWYGRVEAMVFTLLVVAVDRTFYPPRTPVWWAVPALMIAFGIIFGKAETRR